MTHEDQQPSANQVTQAPTQPTQDDETPSIPPTLTADEPSTSSSLDALLSPQTQEFEDAEDSTTTTTARQSVAESEFTDALDMKEVRLSTATVVSVNGAGADTKVDTTAPLAEEVEDSTNTATGSPVTIRKRSSTQSSAGSPSASQTQFSSIPISPSFNSHKKSASVTTIRSSDNAPFILARLGAEERHNRASIDGHHRLQEEFARLQHEKIDEHDSKPNGIDWDFWGRVMGDYEGFAAENSQALAQAIEKGIPDTLRGMMWQLMSMSKDTELEAKYLKLLKESSPHEKAITRDLGRTFPHHEFFHDGEGIGQENLFNVLKAYSVHDPQVGYCQGLPFVVAILLLNMPDEEAFSLLVRLMHSYDLRGHFLPEMPRLQLRLFQFDRLIEDLLPVLHVHFLRQGIKSSMFCSQWFLTMFSYRLPLPVVFRIYDTCLANGIEALLGFGIVLLQKTEAKMLAMKFDELIAFVNGNLFDVYTIQGETEKDTIYKVDDFIQDAAALRITPFMLDAYAHEYEDLVRARDAHAIQIDTLMNSNRNLSNQVKTLENSLASLNTEHVELLNELVKARLRNEEIEGELVRYKLLYAEAMNEKPDLSGILPPVPTPSNNRSSSSSVFSLSATSLFGRRSS